MIQPQLHTADLFTVEAIYFSCFANLRQPHLTSIFVSL